MPRRTITTPLLEPPGTYTVTLKYAGAQESQPLVILKDPASGGSEEAIAEQMQTQTGIVADINDAVTQINSLEMVRGQLTNLSELSKKDSSLGDVDKASEELTTKLVSVER